MPGGRRGCIAPQCRPRHKGRPAEWTPVVFNEQGILIGWGRNVLAERRER